MSSSTTSVKRPSPDVDSTLKIISLETKTKAVVEPLNPPAVDPYVEFIKAQKKREAMWSAERAAKRAKVNSTQVENSREMRRGASQISEIKYRTARTCRKKQHRFPRVMKLAD